MAAAPAWPASSRAWLSTPPESPWCCPRRPGSRRSPCSRRGRLGSAQRWWRWRQRPGSSTSAAARRREGPGGAGEMGAGREARRTANTLRGTKGGPSGVPLPAQPVLALPPAPPDPPRPPPAPTPSLPAAEPPGAHLPPSLPAARRGRGSVPRSVPRSLPAPGERHRLPPARKARPRGGPGSPFPSPPLGHSPGSAGQGRAGSCRYGTRGAPAPARGSPGAAAVGPGLCLGGAAAAVRALRPASWTGQVRGKVQSRQHVSFIFLFLWLMCNAEPGRAVNKSPSRVWSVNFWKRFWFLFCSNGTDAVNAG